MRGRAATRAALVGLLLAGCVTPAGDPTTYAAKAALTAADGVSELRSAELAADQWLDDRLAGPYVETVVVDAELALAAVTATVTSVQPPDDAASDALADELGALLGEGGDLLVALRVAVRRGARADAERLLPGIRDVADELERVEQQAEDAA